MSAFEKYLDIVVANDIPGIGSTADFEFCYDKETDELIDNPIRGLIVGTDLSFDPDGDNPMLLLLFIDENGREYYAEFTLENSKNKVKQCYGLA